MAVSDSMRNKLFLAAVAGAMLLMVIILLALGRGHGGEPASESGPGNPAATTNQGR